ncbi:MAG TPA: hypothetical protein VHH36_01250, partial [Candidatus Thermoplasmatota archaeon]|nr:hypothetical protein [Candidatus Thermoplasmatota archaeon]
PLRLAAEGTTTVTCRVQDRAGLEGTGATVVKLDTAPPKLCSRTARAADGSVVDGRSGWYRIPVEVELATSDGVSGLASLRILLDDAPVPVSAGDPVVVRVPVSDRGAHVLRCEASDKAGNVAAPVEVRVSIDDAPPSCAGVPSTEATNGWHRGGLELTLAADDAGSGLQSVLYALDGATQRDYARPISVSGDGNHRVTCVAQDVAGNVATKVIDLRVDATPPSCEARLEGDFPVKVTLVARDATSGVATHAFRLNGGAQTPYEAPFELKEPGVHEIACLVSDQAGNAREVAIPRVRLAATPEDAANDPPLPAVEEVRTTSEKRLPAPGLPLLLGALAAAAAVARARRRG